MNRLIQNERTDDFRHQDQGCEHGELKTGCKKYINIKFNQILVLLTVFQL